MPNVTVNLAGADQYVLQSTLSAYSDEAYTNARKLSGTGIVGVNPEIDVSTETFTGQVRWFKPLAPVVNVASITDATEGQRTDFGSDYFQYVKTVRTHGARKVNMQQVVSQEDGLAKVSRDFAETRAQDEHNAILAVLKGVAVAEVLNGCASGSGSVGLGGQTFNNDPTDRKYGFYVDLGSNKPIVDASAAVQGAARAEGFLRAIGMAYKDYEPDYAYLVVSPETYASLRSANLVDEDRVTEGNINFSTIFNGKFRLIQTRANQSLSTAELTKLNTGAGIDLVGTKTSFVVLPGAVSFNALAVPDEVEIQRNAAAYKGGGTTDIWYRWGYIAHPAGYNWKGADTEFASEATYGYVVEGGTPKSLTTVASGTLAATSGVWERKVTSALSLQILPIFHN